MQILTGGSFVKLEHKDKIENLIFTAKEMANAAVETDGFVSETENNRRLALDIWQGAEYMTLDHEEAQVKNLFVNNFLDRLREIGGSNAAETVLEKTAAEVEPRGAAGEIESPKDEFLGLVSTDEIEEKSVDAIDDSLDAPESPTAESEVSAPDEFAADVKTEAAEIIEPPKELTAAVVEATNDEIETAGAESERSAVTIENAEGESSSEKQAENNSTRAVVAGAITLPDKEPYRWEKCTITATIQLLPTADESGDSTAKRKAVVSIRTHDFAPQFSVVELGGEGEALLSELLPALGQSFEKYKTDLPLKVMDKMKREKSAPKKQSSKTTGAAKTSTVAPEPKPDKNRTEKPVAKTENAKPTTATTDAPKPAAVIPAASGQQGSLFNF